MIDEQFKQRKDKWLGSFVTCRKIPSSLVINWDQAGINVVPSCNYTMASKGVKHVETSPRSQLHLHFKCYMEEKQIVATLN